MSARPRARRPDGRARWHEGHLTSRALFHNRGGDTPEGGSLWIQLGQLYLIAFTVFGFDGFVLAPQRTMALTLLLVGPTIALAPRGTIARVRVTTPMLLLATWWLISGTWAITPWAWQGETTLALSWLVGTVAVASVLPLRRAMDGLLFGFYSMIVIQVLYCLGKGSSRVHPDGVPGWHGSFGHKNDMAPFLFVACATALLYDRNRQRATGFVTAAVALLVLSQSATAYATVLIMALAYMWLRQHVRHVARVGFGFLVMLVGSLTAITLLTLVVMPYAVGFLGKDPTLSGRTEIWKGVIAAIRERPLLGYGPGLWLDQSRDPARAINRPLGFTVFHAHNGALNIALQLGLIGLVLYVWYWASSLVSAWRKLARDPDLAHWVLLNSIMMFVFAFSEVTILGIWTALIAIGQVYLSRTEALRITRSVVRAPRGAITTTTSTNSTAPSWRRRGVTS